VVGIAAEIAGADGAAVTAECDVQATVTMRVSTHRIAPVIARNTSRRPPGDFDLLKGSFPTPSRVVKLRLEISHVRYPVVVSGAIPARTFVD
jgi:hypothetical protein